MIQRPLAGIDFDFVFSFVFLSVSFRVNLRAPELIPWDPKVHD